MRYLLEKDESTFKRLHNLKDNYFDYRKPNELIDKIQAQIQFHVRDLTYDVQAFNMMSEEKIDITKYIELKIRKQRDDLILNTFYTKMSPDNNYYQVRALYNYASPTYLKVLNSIQYFDKLKLKAHTWLFPLAKMDVRNLVIRDGYLMLGKRGKNKEDAHWLGDFISYAKLMTIEQYDEQLKNFKNEI